MRIAFFLAHLGMGGAERITLNLIEAMVGTGVEIDLVLAKGVTTLAGHEPQNARIVDLGAKRTLSSIPALTRYLREARPDALISALNHTNLVALAAWKRAKIDGRLVLCVHSTMSVEAKRTKTIRHKLIPFLANRYYRRADAIVVVSEGVRDDFFRSTDVPRDLVRLIYNPVVSPRVLQEAKQPFDHPWYAKGEPPVVLGVGTLRPEKDFPTLIKAFALAREEIECRLLILGEGAERPALEALVAKMELGDVAQLGGYCQNPYPAMGGAGVYVLSSFREGLPGVLIEAMACGAPVVATDCPSGPREILHDGKYGALVPVGDSKKLAEAIVATLRNPMPPPPESWSPFLPATAVRQYLELALPGWEPRD